MYTYYTYMYIYIYVYTGFAVVSTTYVLSSHKHRNILVMVCLKHELFCMFQVKV